MSTGNCAVSIDHIFFAPMQNQNQLRQAKEWVNGTSALMLENNWGIWFRHAATMFFLLHTLTLDLGKGTQRKVCRIGQYPSITSSLV